MRRIAVVFIVAVISGISAFAKNLKQLVVKTSPEMHCESCEKKIKSNIRFVKGTKLITTDLKSKTVTITYDADKAGADDFLSAFEKIGYKANILSDKALPKKSHAVDGTTSATVK